MTKIVSKVKPNSELYLKNQKAMNALVAQLETDLSTMRKAVAKKPFNVNVQKENSRFANVLMPCSISILISLKLVNLQHGRYTRTKCLVQESSLELVRFATLNV